VNNLGTIGAENRLKTAETKNHKAPRINRIANVSLSAKTGLAYFFTRKYDQSGLDAYYGTAVDFRTGEIVWEQQIGTGSQFDTLGAGAGDRTYRRAVRGCKRWVYRDVGQVLTTVTVVLAEWATRPRHVDIRETLVNE
jgi:hypothetical protein